MKDKGDNMLHIRFEYRDEMSGFEWREQECTVDSLQECKRLYSLGVDCDYRIISIEKV